VSHGYKIVTGGTDNHLVLWDLRPEDITGSKMEKACDLVHITLNKNAVVGDVSAMAPGGCRIGAPAMTSRGLKEADFEAIADMLHEVLGAVTAPLIMIFLLPARAGAVLDFLRTFTVYVEGVGHVCSLANFDFERHGDPRYGSPHEGAPFLRSRDGKMEKAYVNFRAQHPSWRDDRGDGLLKNIGGAAGVGGAGGGAALSASMGVEGSEPSGAGGAGKGDASDGLGGAAGGGGGGGGGRASAAEAAAAASSSTSAICASRPSISVSVEVTVCASSVASASAAATAGAAAGSGGSRMI
jgi:hypothetical protein